MSPCTPTRLALSSLLTLGILCCLAEPVLIAKNSTLTVASINALETAVSTASAGRTIVLRNGRYDDACKLKGKGTKDKPVIIRAESIGGVEMHNRVALSGEYVSLVGFRFGGKGAISMDGRGLRVSRCTMSNVRSRQWITCSPSSRALEVDYCLFEKKDINRELKRGAQLIRFRVNNKGERHTIHHNHFRDIPKGGAGNGFETVQLITRGNPFDPPAGDCGTRIESNLFERCKGEAEIISIKSNGNILRNNTFRECRGSLVLRHGHRNQAIGNIFFGDGDAKSGGIRLQGRNQVVINNYFQDLKFGVAMMDGTPDKLYVRVDDALVAHNTFVNCQKALLVGINHSKHPNGTVPRQCAIANNIFYTTAEAGDTPGTDQAVVLVQNDQPEGWVWKNNIVQGTISIPPRDGLQPGALHLHFSSNGMALPSLDTPSGTRPVGGNQELETDITGNPRPKTATLGAVQFTGKSLPATGPLTVGKVGPQAEE